MTQPTPYTRSYSFTNAFAAQPTMVFPGNALDAELNNAKVTLDQVLQNLKLLQNDDGTILNGSIGPNQLSTTLNVGFTVPTSWAPGIAYTASPASTVFENSAFYSCLVSHTSSNSFTADLAAGDWILIADLSGIPLVNAAQIAIAPSGGITAGDVQDAMYGLDSRITVSASNIAANTASLANITSTQIVDTTALGRTLMTSATADAALASLNAWSTGDVKLTLKITADTGWVMMNDSTIGSAASGASYANANAQALYTLLWNNVTNTNAPVTGGRGVNAGADWAANKPMALTKVLGRALAISGAGSGLSARALGATVGEETHSLTVAELASHNHPVVDPGHNHVLGASANSAGSIGNPAGQWLGAANIYRNDGSNVQMASSSIVINTTGITISNNGSGTAHNNMQPTSFLNVMVKL